LEKGYQWLVVMQDGASLLTAGRNKVQEFRDAYGDG
jgi:hypothetical protein